MLWLLKRVLLVWLVLLILCTAGLVIGRLDQTPNELQALGFDLCDGKPCFMGITPGVTTWNDAKSIFMKYNAERAFTSSYEQVSYLLRPGLRAFTTRFLGKDLAYNVGVYVPANNSPVLIVRDFIRRYGAPRCVASTMADWSYLAYPSMIVTVYRGRSGRLTLDTPIFQITFGNFASKLITFSCDNFPVQESLPASDWRGFASWDFYATHGLARP